MTIKNTDSSYNPTLFHFIKPFIGLILLIMVGTYAYMHIEGWNLLDSLLMSVETLTTVGFGFVHELSTAGKLFTIVYIVFGVIIFLYIAAEFAERIFMANFDATFQRRAMEHKIKKLKNHYIVCGYGRTGMEIATQLKNSNIDFVVIDKDVALENLLKDLGCIYIFGDATEDEILEKAGIQKAQGLFCALSDDVDNLYLTVSSKNINSDLKIIARCVKATNEQKFNKAGATNTILPYEISARRMVASVVKPLVVDFLDVVVHTKGQDLELQLEQFLLQKGSFLENKSIMESNIREKTGVIIVALKRNNEFMTNPKPDTILRNEDNLIVLGTNQQMSELQKII